MQIQNFQTQLPWSKNQIVNSSGNIYEYLCESLADSLVEYLPRIITIFSHIDIPHKEIIDFIDKILEEIKKELESRNTRCKMFVDYGIFTPSELSHYLTSITHLQPWAIYFDNDGGLGNDPEQENLQVCYFVKNHGLGKKLDENGYCQYLLATGKTPNGNWNWKSDIGHELNHATIAPIPWFAQTAQASVKNTKITQDLTLEIITSDDFAKVIYTTVEIIAVVCRGEVRGGETNLPVVDTVESFIGFLDIASLLFPTVGFEYFKRQYLNQETRYFSINSRFVFELAAMCFKVLHNNLYFINNPKSIEKILQRYTQK